MNTALIQQDPEQQRSNKGTNTNTHTSTTTTSNYVTSHNKLKNAINNDAIPLITTTNSAPSHNPNSTTTTTTSTTTTTIATTVVAQQQRGHGIYGHLSGSLSKIASISRDYLYPVGTHGSLSTSYDAFFTDDGYNEAEQDGIMAGPYTNGPVEFEDSRFYEGRYEDGVHDEYDYVASSSFNSHGHGQYYQQQQQQQQQHMQQRLRFSEEPMATEPTILAGSYRKHRQHSNNSLQASVKQPNDQGAVTPLTASALLSPLRYRDVESAFGIRNEGDKEAHQYHLPSQSQLFQPEFTTGMNGAGYLEESVMEDNINHGDDDDQVMSDDSKKKHKGSWKQQPGGEQEMDQDEQLQLQESGEEDGGDNDEEEGGEDDEEGDNDGHGKSDEGEDDDENDEGGQGGGTDKSRKKSGRPVTSQKTIPKAMVTLPSIHKEHHNQQDGQHSQSDLMQHHSLHHHAPHQYQSMPQQSHYQTQQQLHQQQQHHQQQHQHSTSSLSLSSSTSSTSTSASSYHSSNFISEQQFLLLADDYLLSLSPKKREKALLSNSMYQKFLMVLIQPKNTQVSTAQFRFWAKKMFTLSTTPTHHVVCHGGKPVATKECLYDVLVYCHRKSSHGGRDKTSAEVRQHYSWVPKELIARFVKHCPLCLSRRSTQQRQNGGPATAGTSGPVGSLSLDIGGASSSFLKSHHGQRFESHPPPLHGPVTTAVHAQGSEEGRGNGGEDNGGIVVDQGRIPEMHARFGGDVQQGVQQQPTFVQQPHIGTYGHQQPQQQQQHHQATSSSMQRTGFDTLQSPNSPIRNTHEGSQPWAWRESGVGVVDPKDGGSIDRQQQLHDGSVLQDFSQAHGDDDDGSMQVDRDCGYSHEGDENDDFDGEADNHQAEIHNSKNPTNPSTTAVAAHSGLYYNKSNSRDTTALSPDDDEDSNGSNSPSGMVGISQDLGQYDGHQYRDPAFPHHHQQQQQRLFQQNPHLHRHQHQYSTGLRRHHPYQHQHRHTYDNPTSVNREVVQALTTVHPNGHILHDRHPIHNRARIMALANSAAAASAAITATGGDPAGAPAIPPIHAIRQAALALSQQYRHHHHHHQQQQLQQQRQHHNTHSHHQFASGSHPTYLHHHGHHSQQQQQQQQSNRQVMTHSHPGVVSGHPSSFMYTFTNPDGAGVDGEDGDDDDGDGAYDHEGSEEGLEEDDDGDNGRRLKVM